MVKMSRLTTKERIHKLSTHSCILKNHAQQTVMEIRQLIVKDKVNAQQLKNLELSQP
jgi:hypothetical protein